MPDPTKSPRRFPPPWRVDEATESFCIRDANGQALAYVYFEDEKSPAHNAKTFVVSTRSLENARSRRCSLSKDYEWFKLFKSNSHQK